MEERVEIDGVGLCGPDRGLTTEEVLQVGSELSLVLWLPARTPAFDAHRKEQSLVSPLRDPLLLHCDHADRGNLARFERLLLHDFHNVDQCEANRILVVRHPFEPGLRRAHDKR